jgi:hypothetical protein
VSEAAVRTYAAERRLDTATLTRWLRHAPADRDALLQLAQGLRLGANHLRDVLDQLDDLTARDGVPLHELLARPPLADVVAAGHGRNEAIHALKGALRRLRYPQLSAVEGRLLTLVKQLRLPAAIRVAFPENLEGDHLSLSIEARSAAELRQRLAQAAAACERAEVEEMFRLLGGEW